MDDQIDRGMDRMDLYFFIQTLSNILLTFFQNGIWVIGFFFLLIKTFESDRLMHLSKYVLGAVLTILFIYSVLSSI